VASEDVGFGILIAANVKLHGASPWHLKTLVLGMLIAANMRLHGASPWYLRFLVLSPWYLDLRAKPVREV
jgi:hypothetical protein